MVLHEPNGDAVIAMIVGRSLSHTFPPRPFPSGRVEPEALGAEGLATFGKLKDASFSLRAGEIIGVAGLQGMGQLDLFLACFGMVDLARGT